MRIRDHNQKLIEKISYYHQVQDENIHKVSQAIDSYGNVVNYAYDTKNKKTTITDAKGRVTTYWYDDGFYTIRVQDPDGKSTYTEYVKYDKFNKYGDIKSTTDRNGSKTEYEIDDQGNVTKIIYPDKSTIIKEYDSKNNLIKEIDECGNTTYYIYDNNKINIIIYL
ncbi:RHS repeat protein [Ruminiclostridium herbifermentans]|uniref:RHS repeat protein n=1 Tax=Ruminiclostridium herbifermentans TaxID=2488810 RepID=A0A4U7JEX7_9FIRM|nr:RHS repeat protein [Ruminiclostridium herbifermentans]QNU65621.1 RHS repeat protein [Ruminiclostridium herbifermentans]